MTTGGDIKLFPKPSGTISVGPADIEVLPGANDVTRDPGLETAILIALFTDCRADDGDEIPYDTNGRGGWFGETITGEKFGSKLWLLYRSNLTNATLTRAKEYIEDALDRHVIRENLAQSYDVAVTKEYNRMKISITIKAIDNQTPLYEYFINWNFQTGR